MIVDLAHVMVQVEDMERSIAFYRDELGLEEAFRMNDDEGRLWIAYFHAGNGHFVELMKASKPGLKGVDRGSGYTHMCLLVKGIEDVMKSFEKKSIEVISAVRLGKDGSKQFWIKDPDGNRIELMEYTAESLQNQYVR